MSSLRATDQRLALRATAYSVNVMIYLEDLCTDVGRTPKLYADAFLWLACLR